MRERSFIFIVAVVAALFIGAGALYVYDSSRDDLISKGVQVGGVEIGGLRADAARTKLRRELGHRLSRTVIVRGDGGRFKLTPRAAHVGIDVDSMVAAAVARSREGNILARTLRGLRDQRVYAQLPARISYSQQSVRRFVAQISSKVSRQPRDATVSFESGAPTAVPGRNGLRVETASLRQSVVTDLLTGASKPIELPSQTIKPKVTTAEVASQYPAVLVVDRARFQLKLFKNLALEKTYAIGVGMQGLETPAGLYHIQNKQIDPAWNVPYAAWTGKLAGKVIPGGAPNNPLKARWLGIYDGAGIHGVDPSEYGSIGRAASHGCVRMRIGDVLDLYPRVDVGAPIYIS